MTSNGQMSDSFWKPPMLNPGEYDWWVKRFEAHVCSVDIQLWKVIKEGPIVIMSVGDPNVRKPETAYTDNDYRAIEKNFRAMKVIFQALSPSDEKKVMKYDTAKEIWDGLKRIYGENEDLKRNRILAAAKVYENAYQEKNESLEDFHSRFAGYLDQMELLGETLPEWKVTHHFLSALNSKWDAITTAMQAQSDIKNITLEELVAKLRSNATIHEKKLERRQPDRTQTVALKIEKAFERAQEDNSDDNEEDEITALMTRAFRMAGARGKKFVPREKKESPESENRLCYHCQQKGHLIKDCFKKKRGEPAAQKSRKAMMSAWGEDECDSDNDEDPKAQCLMARTNTSEVPLTTVIANSKYSDTDIARMVKILVEENDSLNRIILDKESEIAGLEESHKLWSEKAMKLETEKLEHKCVCSTCQVQHGTNEDFRFKLNLLETDNEDLRLALSHARKSEEEMKEKWTKELETNKKLIQESHEKFVRAGIGYTDETPAIKAPNPVTRVEPTENPIPFDGGKAFAIWKKHTRNTTPLVIDFDGRKKAIAESAEKSKYVLLKCHRVCWHCGRKGHYRSECHRLRRGYEKNYLARRRSEGQNSPDQPPRVLDPGRIPLRERRRSTLSSPPEVLDPETGVHPRERKRCTQISPSRVLMLGTGTLIWENRGKLLEQKLTYNLSYLVPPLLNLLMFMQKSLLLLS